MPDIIEQSTLYKIRQIEFTEAQYYEQLIKVLDKIEQDITSLVGKTLNTEDGKLLREAKFSLVLQPQIKAILEKEYLPWADKVVREGFNKQAKAINVKSPTLTKEIDKEIARAVIDDDDKLNIIFEEIDTKPEVGEFTQDEVEKETVEEEEV